MNIAIDVSPLETGHKIRGTGFYLQHLKDSLQTYHPEHTYHFFSQKDALPSSIELIHYPYFEPFFLTLPLKKKHKTIVTVHDLTPLEFPEAFPVGMKGSLKWQIQKQALRSTSAIITDSHSSKKSIEKYAGIPSEKIHVVYLAAGEEFKQMILTETEIKRLRATYKLPEKFALYVGDVTANKNLPRLMQAIEKAQVPLVLVGKSLVQKDFDRTNPWNHDLVEVQKYASQNPLIQLLGFVETQDLISLYNLASVFVFPSYYEGFGLPVLEAMQSGCPVVTTHAGSLKEVAEDAAEIVDPFDVESIARGIKRVFENESAQKIFKDKGLQQTKKFSWEKTADETVKLYEKISR